MKRAGKIVCAALAGVLCLTAALAGVKAAVVHTMPDYPLALGNINATEKITGTYLVRAGAEQDLVTVFGSSELKTTDICTHPANVFAAQRAGVALDLVGRGSCQSLIHALCIAGSSDALTGRKVVLITAPQSYVEGGIAPDLFMANFSELQYLRMLEDEELSDDIKQYLSSRVQELCEAYRENTGSKMQLHTAAGRMSKAIAQENAFAQMLLKPYCAISAWLLDAKDLFDSAKVMRAYNKPDATPQADIDWAQEEELAMQQAQQMVTANEFYMQDDYYNTYIGLRLAQQEGKDKNISYAVSPEYDDLRCLLDICAAKNIEVLFVHVPMHGSWSDYTGFTQDKRTQYYDNVRKIVQGYENVSLLDLTGYEYEPYFLCDTMHLGWKGWLEVDKALVEFNQNNP